MVRRVNIPAAMIAVALQETHKIHGLNERLGKLYAYLTALELTSHFVSAPPPSHTADVEFDVCGHNKASGKLLTFPFAEFCSQKNPHSCSFTGSSPSQNQQDNPTKRKRGAGADAYEMNKPKRLFKSLGIIELTDSED